VRHPGQFDAIEDIEGWSMDDVSAAEIDAILGSATVVTPRMSSAAGGRQTGQTSVFGRSPPATASWLVDTASARGLKRIRGDVLGINRSSASSSTRFRSRRGTCDARVREGVRLQRERVERRFDAWSWRSLEKR